MLLIGSCPEKHMLVYELMDNGSLDAHLFKPTMPDLHWQVRGPFWGWVVWCLNVGAGWRARVQVLWSTSCGARCGAVG